MINNKNSFAFIWLPWSGKTTLSRVLSKEINLPCIDFDNHVLEKISTRRGGELCNKIYGISVEDIVKKEVSTILKTLWTEKFRELEEKIWMDLRLEKVILSTSGSLPLYREAMQHIRKQAHVIYINIDTPIILERMPNMKADRIIGMDKYLEQWMNEQDALRAVLKERENIYRDCHDFEFKPNVLGTKEETAEQFIESYNKRLKSLII